MYGCEHVAPQLIPEGWLTTVPGPPPVFETFRVAGGRLVKVAVTACGLLIVTLQLPVPEQPAPDQPSKLEPRAGAAVSRTLVPYR